MSWRISIIMGSCLLLIWLVLVSAEEIERSHVEKQIVDALRLISNAPQIVDKGTTATLIIGHSKPLVNRLIKLLHKANHNYFNSEEAYTNNLIIPISINASSISEDLLAAYMFNKIGTSIYKMKLLFLIDNIENDNLRQQLSTLVDEIRPIIQDLDNFEANSIVVVNLAENKTIDSWTNEGLTANNVTGFVDFLLTNDAMQGVHITKTDEKEFIGSIKQIHEDLILLPFRTLTEITYHISPNTLEFVKIFENETTTEINDAITHTISQWYIKQQEAVRSKDYGIKFQIIGSFFRKNLRQLSLLHLQSLETNDSITMVKFLLKPEVSKLTGVPRSYLQKLITKQTQADQLMQLAEVEPKPEFAAPLWVSAINETYEYAKKYKNWYMDLSNNGHIKQNNNRQQGRSMNAATSKSNRQNLNRQQELEFDQTQGISNVAYDCSFPETLILIADYITVDDSKEFDLLLKSCGKSYKVNNYLLSTVVVKLNSLSINPGAFYTIMSPTVEILGGELILPALAVDPIPVTNETCNHTHNGRQGNRGNQGTSLLLISGSINASSTIWGRGGDGGNGTNATFEEYTPVKLRNETQKVRRMFELRAGLGGIGGYPGTVKVINLNKHSNVHVRQETGRIGQLGETPTGQILKYSLHEDYICGRAQDRTAFKGIEDLSININKYLILGKMKNTSKNFLQSMEFFQNVLIHPQVSELYSSVGLAQQFTFLTELDTAAQVGNVSEHKESVFGYFQTLKNMIKQHSKEMSYNGSTTISCKSTCESTPKKRNKFWPTEKQDQCMYSGQTFYNGLCWYNFLMPDVETRKQYHYIPKNIKLLLGQQADQLLQDNGTHLQLHNAAKDCLIDKGVLKPWDCFLANSTLRIVSDCVQNNTYWYSHTTNCDIVSPRVLKNQQECVNNNYLYNDKINGCTEQLYRPLAAISSACMAHGYDSEFLNGTYHCKTGKGSVEDEAVNDCLLSMKTLLPVEKCGTLLQNIDESNKTDLRLTLKTAYAATIVTLRSMRKWNNDLIIDIETHVKDTQAGIPKFKSPNKYFEIQKHINWKNKEFKKEIDDKIKKTVRLLENYVHPQINATSKKIANESDELVETVQYIITHGPKSKLATAAKEFSNKITNEIGAELLHTVTGFAGAVAVLATATSALLVGKSALTQGTISQTDVQELMEEMKKDVESSTQKLTKWLNNQNEKIYSALDHELEKLEPLVYKNLDKFNFQSVKETFQQKYEMYKNLKNASLLDHVAIKAAVQQIANDTASMAQSYKEKSEKIRECMYNAESIVRRINIAIYSAKMGVKAEDSVDLASILLEAVGNLIEPNQIRIFEKMEETVYSKVIPLINATRGATDKWKNAAVDEETIVSIINHQSLVREALRATQFNIHEYYVRFATILEFRFNHLIEAIHDAISTVFSTIDQIQQWQDTQELVGYISDLKHRLNETTFDAPGVTDVMDKMKHAVVVNSAKLTYNIALTQMRHYVFPFAKIMLEDLILPPDFQTRSIDDAVDLTADYLRGLVAKMEQQKNGIVSGNDLHMQSQYFKDEENNPAFYSWKYENHAEDVKNLLQGNSIVLRSNVVLSPNSYDAMRFSTIDLELRLRLRTEEQVNFDFLLNRFKITMTHMGNSNFRVGEKYYTFVTPAQNITFTFEKLPSGEPKIIGGIYQKLKDGEYVLSPYTTWVMRLANKEGRGFSSLKDFYDEDVAIDIYLNGKGTFLQGNSHDLEVDKYYDEDFLISKLAYENKDVDVGCKSNV